MAKHEISSWHKHVDIRHTREDGGTCLHSMSWDEFAEFYETAKAVRLTMIGMEEVECRVSELQGGDVFESLGAAVKRTEIIRPGYLVVYLRNGGTMKFDMDQKVRVNRMIQ